MNITLKQAEGYIAELRPFISGNLTAQWERVGYDDHSLHYCVRSYGVEIASATWGDVYPVSWSMQVNAYNHSVTTSKHANLIRRTWSALMTV